MATGAVALAVAFSFITAVILAANPGLHARWHKDAGQPKHECAVTLLTKHHLTPASPPSFFLTETPPCSSVRLRAPAEVSFSLHSILPPERGPPFFFTACSC